MSAGRQPVRGIVLLSDVQASRSIEDRAAFADRLDELLAAANDRPEGMLGAFERQAGLDEFAGVLPPGPVADLLIRMWLELHPVAVRFALVLDTLDVVPEEQAAGRPGASRYDGPAFHRASALLEEARSGPELTAVRVASEERTDRLLSALADALYGSILEWTERQAEVVRTYRSTGSQQKAADLLGIEQSTVSRSLKAASYARIEGGLRTFGEELDGAIADSKTT